MSRKGMGNGFVSKVGRFSSSSFETRSYYVNQNNYMGGDSSTKPSSSSSACHSQSVKSLLDRYKQGHSILFKDKVGQSRKKEETRPGPGTYDLPGTI